jgi:hypothetical protein
MKIDRVQKVYLIIVVLLFLFCGFSININNFHWNYRGLISIIFNL